MFGEGAFYGKAVFGGISRQIFLGPVKARAVVFDLRVFKGGLVYGGGIAGKAVVECEKQSCQQRGSRNDYSDN